MCGAVPSLPHTLSWRGAQFKKISAGTILLLLFITLTAYS